MTSSRRIEDLHPDFQPMVRKLLELGNAVISDTGYIFFITDGFRSKEEQARLYAQGRTTPGRILTMARAGQSAHNYGLAVDCAFQKDGKLFYLNDLYERIYPIARKLGFVLGADWTQFKDRPHFEFPGWQVKAKETDKKEAPKTQTPEYTLYESKRNLLIASARGAHVRTGPYTNYESLGVFAANVEFAAIGFTTGEEILGNNLWWVTQDEKFVWSGATNLTPTLPTDNDSAGETDTDKDERIEELQSQVRTAKAVIKDLRKEITDNFDELQQAREAAANVEAFKVSNQVLKDQVEVQQQRINALQKNINAALVQAFKDWQLIEISAGGSRWLQLPSTLISIIGLYAKGMTSTHVLGYKKNARVRKSEVADQA